MAGPLHDTLITPPRRADAGQVRLGRRDTDGLILCAGHAATGRLAPGPAWCWLTG